MYQPFCKVYTGCKYSTEKGHAHLFVQVPRYSWLLTSEQKISGPSRKFGLGMISSHTLYLTNSIPGSCKYPSFFFFFSVKLVRLLTENFRKSGIMSVLIYLYDGWYNRHKTNISRINQFGWYIQQVFLLLSKDVWESAFDFKYRLIAEFVSKSQCKESDTTEWQLNWTDCNNWLSFSRFMFSVCE